MKMIKDVDEHRTSPHTVSPGKMIVFFSSSHHHKVPNNSVPKYFISLILLKFASNYNLLMNYILLLIIYSYLQSSVKDVPSDKFPLSPTVATT